MSNWRERFEEAASNPLNRSIYHDRPSADPATYRPDPPPLRNVFWRVFLAIAAPTFLVAVIVGAIWLVLS